MTKRQNANVVVEQQERGTNMEERKFNVWENTYKTLVREFIASGEKDTFSFKAKHYFDKTFTSKDGQEIHIDGVKKVLTFLFKNDGLKVKDVKLILSDDKTHEVYQITIKDFNIKTEVNGKYGKYKLFAKHYGQMKLA